MLLYGKRKPSGLFCFLHLFAAFSFQNKHTFAFWRILLIKTACPVERIHISSFMFFREFPAYRDFPVPSESFRKFFDCLYKSVRRFIEDDRPCLLLHLRKNLLPLLLILRQERLKCKSSGRHAGYRKSRDTRARSRKRRHSNSF